MQTFINRISDTKRWCLSFSIAALLSACVSTGNQSSVPNDSKRSDPIEQASAKTQTNTLLTEPSSRNSAQALEQNKEINRYKAQKVWVLPAVRAQIHLAIRHKQQGKLEQAEQLFTRLIAQNPNLSGLYVHLGDIKKRQDKRNDALGFYQQAVRVNGLNYVAQNRLATLYRQTGDFSLAKQHYLLALKSWPDYALAHRNLGILYDLYLQQKTQALAHYKRYLDLSVEQDKSVQYWIKDLSRQLKQQESKS
ncbi:tetratricopeptide repeat protein [Thalassotalea aquiviva]|uniref:tetratricopeptide repeat protein n=1 Tax=Thalassotalea aquiviva TaxID=3242415 RepID=UPI00352A60CA